MNKPSPEYLRVRTEIAKKYCGHNSKIGFILADRILAIKGIAILADDQTLPDYPMSNLENYSKDEVDNKCLTTQIIMEKTNFKKMVE